jgi:signal peptidase I
MILNDSRNMPVFPKNTENSASFLSSDAYFLMGDNRFNSLDMRHSYETYAKPLTEHDPFSMYYYSNMEQREVSKKRILGTTSFRFWPLSRVGIPGNHYK